MALVDDIFKLTKSLYPTGRAFWLDDETIQQFVYALCISEAEAVEANLSILSSILPDNDDFTTEDAALWEKRLNLTVAPTNATLEERKALIERKYAFPGSFIYRQNWRFIEYQLQLAGFNVYVHENRFPDGGGGYEYYDWTELQTIQHSEDQEHGIDTSMGDPGWDIVANLADSPEPFDIGDESNFKGAFFIGGETFPDRVIVSPPRERELRKLILALKPANTFAILLVDYWYTGNISFMSGDEILLVDSGDNLELVVEA